MIEHDKISWMVLRDDDTGDAGEDDSTETPDPENPGT